MTHERLHLSRPSPIFETRLIDRRAHPDSESAQSVVGRPTTTQKELPRTCWRAGAGLRCSVPLSSSSQSSSVPGRCPFAPPAARSADSSASPRSRPGEASARQRRSGWRQSCGITGRRRTPRREGTKGSARPLRASRGAKSTSPTRITGSRPRRARAKRQRSVAELFPFARPLIGQGRQRFVEEQAAFTQAYLEKNQDRDKLHAALKQNWCVPSVDRGRKLNGSRPGTTQDFLARRERTTVRAGSNP